MYRFVVLLFLLIPSISSALTPEEEYRQIQEKMKEQKKRLSETQERESSVLGEIDAANRRLGIIESELMRQRRELQRTQSEISIVQAEIARTEQDIKRQKEWIRRKVRLMHRFGYSSDALALFLGSTDVSQMMRLWKYLELLSTREHAVLERYRENVRALDKKRQRLTSLELSLRRETERIKIKEDDLEKKKQEKEVILASVREEKALRQKMLAELKEASQRLLDIIREASKTDTYSGTGFARLKGRLPWPVNGRLALPYGTQRDPQFDTPIFRNGIHLQTDPGAEARSVHSGRVIFAEWFKGFGQLIIINHGSGYHTLYGNLSEIFSRVGDIIKEDQVIGKVGTSGVLNAPGLYFEVRYKGKPLDPSQWLRTRKR